MTDQHFVPRRAVQPYAPAVQQGAAPENTAQNNDLQQDAADLGGVQAHAPTEEIVQPTVLPSPEDYTISVDEVRAHFRAKGVSKSKDTVQRWCRTGELDCQKRGVLGRYFTTETSLLQLEQKLLPDMIAESVGGATAISTQLHEAAQPDDSSDAPLHAGAEEAERSSMQAHAPEHEEAQSSTQLHTPASTAARSDVQQDVHLHAGERGGSAEVAELRAQVKGLTSQLEQAQEINQFLRDEIVSARGQRGDVVKIAEQMLGTLETIAIGGRLERPKGESPRSEPVRYSPTEGHRREV